MLNPEDLITTILVVASANEYLLDEDELDQEDPTYEEAMAAINANEQ